MAHNLPAERRPNSATPHLDGPPEGGSTSPAFATTISPGVFVTAPTPRSPRERIVKAIINGLYEGRYLPGDRLIEARLTAEYGVSRGPVREALNRLSAMGVVSLNPQRGAEIRRLSLAEAIDVLVVVQDLVGLAAQLAAERIHLAGAADQVRDALLRLETCETLDDSSQYAAAREHFYATLHHIGGNRELSRVLSGMQTHLVRSQFGRAMAGLDRSRREDYRQIAAHVLAGRPSRARTVARGYIGRVIRLLSNLGEP